MKDCFARMLKINRLSLLVRKSSRIEHLSSNLSILGKSKGEAPITLECIDLIKHPSADVALFDYCTVEGSRVSERRYFFAIYLCSLARFLALLLD